MKVLLISFWLGVGSLIGYEYQLSICAIFQDEGPYLKEWIEYHHYMGVEHFWLYNNNSSDNFREVLAPYIKKGWVELIEWPSDTQTDEYQHHCYVTQPRAYTDALNRARKKSKWLGFIDLDEFIFPIQEESILECLEKRFYFCPGVTINWQFYGTSHVDKIPDNVHIWDALVYKAPWDDPRNQLFKSIVQPERVIDCDEPHWCNYVKPYGHVTTHYTDPRRMEIFTDILVINHYWTRDEWFFHNVKIPRNLRWGKDLASLLQTSESMNQVFDNSLSVKMAKAPFLPK